MEEKKQKYRARKPKTEIGHTSRGRILSRKKDDNIENPLFIQRHVVEVVEFPVQFHREMTEKDFDNSPFQSRFRRQLDELGYTKKILSWGYDKEKSTIVVLFYTFTDEYKEWKPFRQERNYL